MKNKKIQHGAWSSREACLEMLNSSASQQHYKEWEEETQRVKLKELSCDCFHRPINKSSPRKWPEEGLIESQKLMKYIL